MQSFSCYSTTNKVFPKTLIRKKTETKLQFIHILRFFKTRFKEAYEHGYNIRNSSTLEHRPATIHKKSTIWKT